MTLKVAETVEVGQKKAVKDTIDELIALRPDADEVMWVVVTHDKRIEWGTSGGRSRIWTVGALENLKKEILENDDDG